VRERMVDAGVEDPVTDLGLFVSTHCRTFSRNSRYVYRWTQRSRHLIQGGRDAGRVRARGMRS
jgi:hypothetical protein